MGRSHQRRKRWPCRRKAPFAQCAASGKICYPDTAAAQKLLDHALISQQLAEQWFGSREWSVRQEKRIYRCPDCHQWHLTSET